MQADEQVQRGQQQATEDCGDNNELADRRAVIRIEPLIQRDQGLLAQGSKVGEQRVEAAFEVLWLEVDAAAKHTVVENFQAAVEVFQAVMILTGPGLQLGWQTRLQQAGGFHQLLAGVTNATAQVAQLQAALQGELPGDHRSLADCGETPDPLDQVRCVLRGNLRQQVGFQPRREGQAIVHDDLLAQGLQRAQGIGEAVITVRPPADTAEAFRIQAIECGLQRLKAFEDCAVGALLVQSIAQLGGGLQHRRLHAVEGSHGGEGGRCRLTIGLGGAPAGGAVALRGEQVVQCIQREQLTHTGTFAGDQIELLAIVMADHQQAAGQRQNEQQKQQLEFTCEAKPPQQFDPR